MKHLVLTLVVVTLSTLAATAGSISLDLPRLDFPDQGGNVTQGCNALVQACEG